MYGIKFHYSTLIFSIIIIFLSLKINISNGESNYSVNPIFSVSKIGNVPGPRSILVDEIGDILVLASFTSQIICLYNNTQNTEILEEVILVDEPDLGLNHGLFYKDNYLYASNPYQVLRWNYSGGSRELIKSPPQTVVKNIPGTGIHITRTIIIDDLNRLFVQVGAEFNVDADSNRSRIKVFNLENGIPLGGFDFIQDGDIFADGLRNTVGLGFDLSSILWGVENGGDEVYRPDLGDTKSENPGEELNKFNGTIGRHYGYPYCFTSYNISGYAPGTQFAWPLFMDDGIHSDTWCQNPENNNPPVLSLPAHEAPLSINFYNGKNCESGGSLPCSAIGDSLIAFHGSYYKNNPGGFSVTWLKFSNGEPTGEIIEIMAEKYKENCKFSNINSCLRPVSAIFDNEGRILMTSDYSNEIFRISYIGNK